MEGMKGFIERLFSIIDRILDSLGFTPGIEAGKEVKVVICYRRSALMVNAEKGLKLFALPILSLLSLR